MEAAQQTPLSLLERLRSSPDEPSWERLSDLYTPLIRRWLGRGGLGSTECDDLTQDIMVVLVREIPTFRHSGHRGAFRSWLRTVATNRLRNHWRARRGSPSSDEDGRLEEIEDRVDVLGELVEAEHHQLVARRLLELMEPEFTPGTWLAFRRQVLEGKSAAEAAAELGVTANAVLIAKSRVLRRLRQEGQDLLG